MRNSKLIFIGIIIFGIFIYLYKLNSIPNGFYIDEALPTYNAYSILKTSKDEYGKFLPIVFRFYGSYNPSLYTYLTVLPVWLLGLNIFSGRFISILSGLSFCVSLLLILKKSGLFKNNFAPLAGTFLAIISPWLILYSRVGYEVTLALSLFSFGTYFLWGSLKNSSNLIWASIFLCLSTYAAYTERFIVPMLLASFLVIFHKKIFKKKFKRNIIWSFVISLILEIPNFYILLTPSFFPKTNLIAGGSVAAQISKLNIVFPVLASSVLAVLREFLSQYVTYFSPQSLFFLPDPDLQRSIPTLSVFYFWMVIPYFIGIYYIWKKRNSDFVRFLLILLFISPIPAAATKDPFATHRAIPLLLPLLVIISFGINVIKEKLSERSVWILSGLLILISLLFLWRGYFVFLPKERAIYWQYGFADLADEVEKRPNMHFVIDQTRLKPAYINLAFYLEYPPGKFQKANDQHVKTNYYFNTPFDSYHNFGQIETRNIDWRTDPLKKQILVGDEYSISTSQATEHNLEKIFEIRDPMNRIIFIGWETNPEKGILNK